jgi:hypothetical protein
VNGWTCPKCGACYAPFIGECHRCNSPNTTQIATGTGVPFPCTHPSVISDSAGLHCAYCGKRIDPTTPPIITCEAKP